MTFTTANKSTALVVRDVMTSPVYTLGLDDSIGKAKQLFDRHRFHHAVVLENRRVFGVVSDRDILKAISPFVGNPTLERSQDANTLKRRVHQIVTRGVITIEPETSIAEAANKLWTEHVSCLPVVDSKGALVGILTARDLLRWLAGVPL
jgi:acetoin utilization protein AcuB